MTDFSFLSSESYDLLNTLFKVFTENNIIDSFISYSNDVSPVVDIVEYLGIKLQGVLKPIEDEKWDFYFKQVEFCFKYMLYENEVVQRLFTNILLKLLRAPAVPLVKFKELGTLLSVFLNGFNNLRIKFDVFWINIFDLFNNLFQNNELLYSSVNDFDMIFSAMKKYLISFVDFNKKAKKYQEAEYKQQIETIYAFLNEKSINIINSAKSFSERSNTWESGKNLFKLYFSDFK